MTLRSFAKINLAIHLLGKRDDGYHEIVTLMETVDLADELEVSGQEKGTTITCSWALELGDEDLADLAAELGSDVPFCLRGGVAIASGRGEKVAWLDAPGPRHYVLVCPPLEVASGWAYSQWKMELTKDASCINLSSSVVQAGDADRLASSLHNDLEPAVRAAHPEIDRARGLLADAGLKGILMSGSGPSVFGLATGRAKAERIAQDLRGRVEPSWRVFAVSSSSRRDAAV